MTFQQFEVTPRFIQAIVPHLLHTGAITIIQRQEIFAALEQGRDEGDLNANRAANILGLALRINEFVDRQKASL